MAAPRLQIRRGTSAPSGAIGLAGEPFVDTTNSNMYFSTAGTVGSQGSAFVHVGGASYTARTDEFLTASVASTSVGSVTIKDAQATQNSVTIDVPATVTTSYNFTLPADDGTSGFVLQTDGSGNTSWVAQTSGYTGWDITDGTNTESIASGNTLTVTGSTGIDATVSGTDTLTIAIDSTVATSSSDLSFFAATSSAQLANVINDETGTGVLVFATSPTMSTSIVSGTSSFDLIDTTATTINFAGAATTGNYGYDGSDPSTSNLSTGAVASGNTKTVNIGTGGVAGSTTNVNLGSSNGTSTVTVNGDLTVTGTTTTVNSTVVTIADTNIVLASGAADAAAADGAGLTIDGANATWTFENNFVESAAENAWVTSEHLAIAADKNLYMDGGAIIVLDDTTATTTGYVSMLNTIIDAGTY